MKRLIRLALAGLLLGGVIDAMPGTAATAGMGPYDGHLPFHCKIQHLGTGTKFPHPKADPLCVDYDKTHQNVDHLGIIDFLSHEPARFAAVRGKCFYYQRDHWRSAVLQDDESTEIYNWDGAYWYDLATGAGGVFVKHFTINNRSADFGAFPAMPAKYKRYFGYGRGGWQATTAVPVDPACTGKKS
ncbi:MAG TPA: hypothetical protein VHE56_10155 [Mycobacteriales bacterium]|nr:hypothetical protein [Mycobacteriales bacterium]